MNGSLGTMDSLAALGALVLVQDVIGDREVEPAEEAIRHQVVEAMNHEFRTPLAALLAHVELVRDREDELPEELVASFEAIERATWRLRDLIMSVTELIDEAGSRPGR